METREKLIERPDSCEISCNKNGEWSGKIKVYAENIDDAMSKALEKAEQLNKIIVERNV